MIKLNPAYYTQEEWEEMHTPSPPTAPSDYVDLVDSGILPMNQERYDRCKEMVEIARKMRYQQHLIEMMDVDNYSYTPEEYIWLVDNYHLKRSPEVNKRYDECVNAILSKRSSEG